MHNIVSSIFDVITAQMICVEYENEPLSMIYDLSDEVIDANFVHHTSRNVTGYGSDHN